MNNRNIKKYESPFHLGSNLVGLDKVDIGLLALLMRISLEDFESSLMEVKTYIAVKYC